MLNRGKSSSPHPKESLNKLKEKNHSTFVVVDQYIQFAQKT